MRYLGQPLDTFETATALGLSLATPQLRVKICRVLERAPPGGVEGALFARATLTPTLRVANGLVFELFA